MSHKHCSSESAIFSHSMSSLPSLSISRMSNHPTSSNAGARLTPVDVKAGMTLTWDSPAPATVDPSVGGGSRTPPPELGRSSPLTPDHRPAVVSRLRRSDEQQAMIENMQKKEIARTQAAVAQRRRNEAADRERVQHLLEVRGRLVPVGTQLQFSFVFHQWRFLFRNGSLLTFFFLANPQEDRQRRANRPGLAASTASGPVATTAPIPPHIRPPRVPGSVNPAAAAAAGHSARLKRIHGPFLSPFPCLNGLPRTHNKLRN